jgi:small-conductance mechanosensitive channel
MEKDSTFILKGVISMIIFIIMLVFDWFIVLGLEDRILGDEQSSNFFRTILENIAIAVVLLAMVFSHIGLISILILAIIYYIVDLYVVNSKCDFKKTLFAGLYKNRYFLPYIIGIVPLINGIISFSVKTESIFMIAIGVIMIIYAIVRFPLDFKVFKNSDCD